MKAMSVVSGPLSVAANPRASRATDNGQLTTDNTSNNGGDNESTKPGKEARFHSS
jgi:hypothetical protein